MKRQIVVVKGLQSMTMEKVDGLLVASAPSLAAHAEKEQWLDLLTKQDDGVQGKHRGEALVGAVCDGFDESVGVYSEQA